MRGMTVTWEPDISDYIKWKEELCREIDKAQLEDMRMELIADADTSEEADVLYEPTYGADAEDE